MKTPFGNGDREDTEHVSAAFFFYTHENEKKKDGTRSATRNKQVYIRSSEGESGSTPSSPDPGT